MSWLKQVADGKKTRRAPFLTDGIYKLALVNLVNIEAGFNGHSVVAEWVVREAAPSPQRPEVKPNPVGSRASTVINFKSRQAGANLREIMEALVGEKLSTDEAEILAIFTELHSPGQPMRGKEVSATSYFIAETKEAKRPFTGFNFDSLEMSDDELAASRKRVDTEGL
jgi:hypothetical protein